MASAARVMVSSTFYDLKQVRADLVNFLADQMGFQPLVSELGSFPVDPDADTAENCRRRVERDADLLVLIVGGRYGSVDASTAKSITNLEYLAARAKGIPIYAFVEKGVLGLLPIYKANPDADFSAVVDDPRVLDFVLEIREVHSVWSHDFELAQDIIATLRCQFSYLMAEGLTVLRKLRKAEWSQGVRLLSGQALRFALEKPVGWEYRLFAAALKDEIAERAELRRRYDLGLVIGQFQYIPTGGTEIWLRARMNEFKGLTSGVDALINRDLQKSIGAPGEPGDAELIVFCSRSIGLVYEEALKWSMRLRRTSCDDFLKPVLESMTAFIRDIIGTLEALGPRLIQTLKEMDEASARGEDVKRSIPISPLELSGQEEFHEAIEKAMREINAIK